MTTTRAFIGGILVGGGFVAFLWIMTSLFHYVVRETAQRTTEILNQKRKGALPVVPATGKPITQQEMEGNE